jgi:hypothetical protein
MHEPTARRPVIIRLASFVIANEFRRQGDGIAS